MVAKSIDAEEFDRKFDDGEDVSEYVDWSRATRPLEELKRTQRVNVDFPPWIVDALDKEARRLGVSRQAVIKMWVAGKLDEKRAG